MKDLLLDVQTAGSPIFQNVIKHASWKQTLVFLLQQRDFRILQVYVMHNSDRVSYRLILKKLILFHASLEYLILTCQL